MPGAVGVALGGADVLATTDASGVGDVVGGAPAVVGAHEMATNEMSEATAFSAWPACSGRLAWSSHLSKAKS